MDYQENTAETERGALSDLYYSYRRIGSEDESAPDHSKVVSAIKISYLQSTSDLVFLFLAVLGNSWRSVLFFCYWPKMRDRGGG